MFDFKMEQTNRTGDGESNSSALPQAQFGN